MKRIRSIVVAAVGLVALAPSHAETVNRVVARVNDRIATLYDYQQRYQDGLARIASLPTDPVEREEFLAEHARDTMKLIFEELLILSRSDQLGIYVADTQVDEAMEDMREQNNLQDNDAFRAALAGSGVVYDDLYEQYRTQLAFQQVMGREVYSQIEISEEDLRRYYRENEDEFRDPERRRIREIVVLEPAGADAAAQELAKVLVDALRSGATLEDLKADHDDETLSPIIEVGWVTPGDLDSALEEAVFALEVGEASDPIRARGGLHIAELLELEDSFLKPFKEVEEEIELQQRMERTGERLEGYLVELEQKSYLFLDPPPEAAGFRTATGETPLSAEFPTVGSVPAVGTRGGGAATGAAAAEE